MTYGAPARASERDAAPPACASSIAHGDVDAPGEAAAAPTTGITFYGCGPDEAMLLRELAPRFGVMPTVVEGAVSDANAELASGNRCISIGHKTQIAGSTLLALSRAGVRHVSTRSVGCDHIDVRYAESIGLSVRNVAYSPNSVADFTLMLMLMLLRHARPIIGRAELHDYRPPDRRGTELCDLTVGVIGTGRIGAAVIDRLRPFGCRILANDPRPKMSADYVAIDELLQRSDLVTLHAPLSSATRHLLNGDRIERMKPGAMIVNTGRGALLDTDALVRALESGQLGGAALDVLEGEEGVFYADWRNEPIGSELLLRLHALANVLITPHIAYDTDRALRDMVEGSILSCLSFEGRA